jgi:hypothetical protein
LLGIVIAQIWETFTALMQANLPLPLEGAGMAAITQPETKNDEAHDFCHAAMHRKADWPVLARIEVARKSAAQLLDSRTVAAIYADTGKDEWAAMSITEPAFAKAKIKALPA